MSEHKVSRNCPVCEAPLGANDGDCCQSCTYEPDAVEEANALAQATRERAELESALADEKRTIEKLIRERDIAISARVLRSELSAAEKAKRKLSERVAELEAEWNVAVANRELAEDEARHLRSDLNEARKQRDTFHGQLCDATAERDSLLDRVNGLEEELDQLASDQESDRAVDRATHKSGTASCLDDSLTCPECGIEYCAMGLRDQVAMRALQGLLAHNGEDDSCSAIREAIRYADAFLEERSK